MTTLLQPPPPAPPPAAPAVDEMSAMTGDAWHAALGFVPLSRIILHPPPGTATVADAVERTERVAPTELVDGTLVEKGMGRRESRIGMEIGRRIGNHAIETGIGGEVAGADGSITMRGGNMRMPDVAFTRPEDLPEGDYDAEAAPLLPATLAVEVMSRTNTRPEIDRKLRELFESGTRLAWVLDPPSRTARVYTAADMYRELADADTLDGGAVLPGLKIPLGALFDL